MTLWVPEAATATLQPDSVVASPVLEVRIARRVRSAFGGSRPGGAPSASLARNRGMFATQTQVKSL